MVAAHELCTKEASELSPVLAVLVRALSKVVRDLVNPFSDTESELSFIQYL